MNILVTVDKKLVQEQINRLYGYLTSADTVTEDSTYAEINMAQNILFMARGAFSVLWNFRLLPNWIETENKINRIEAKHLEILEQKRSSCSSPIVVNWK